MNWKYYKGKNYSKRIWKVSPNNNAVLEFYKGEWCPVKVRNMNNWLKAHGEITSTEEEVFLELI